MKFTTEDVTIRFVSDPFGRRKGFDISIQYVDGIGTCQHDHFICANDNCLSASLICDGKDDCGDDSDETTICYNAICSSASFSWKNNNCTSNSKISNGQSSCRNTTDKGEKCTGNQTGRNRHNFLLQ